MKSNGFYVWIIVSSFLLFGCSQNIFENKSTNTSDVEITEDLISKKYYTKNLSEDFSAFLRNPNDISYRSITGNESSKDELLFSTMWDDLTDEEKEMLQNNSENIELLKDSLLSVGRDSSVGRAVEQGDTSEIDSIAAVYSYNEWLEDNFGENLVNISFKDEEFGDQPELVPASLAINYLTKIEHWEEIEEILLSMKSKLTVKDIKCKYKELSDTLDIIQLDRGIFRASATVDYQTRPIRERVGNTLRDGTVMLTCFKKKAYPIIGGKWAHAGIFSEDAYIKYGRKDSSYCVYTAQPNGYDDFPDFMKPDRQNHCCLDTICMYSYQKKMATILPLDYSKSKATEAIKYAKEAFYDKPDNKYNIPIWEFFRLGNSSHDMTVKNPYCSKVVYSAWKKAGVDLDSNTFGGNLVTPDDLYGSSFNRYIIITLNLLFWSKTWKINTYSGTSYLCTEEYQ